MPNRARPVAAGVDAAGGRAASLPETWVLVGCLAGRLATTFADVGPALLQGGDPTGVAPLLAAVVGAVDALFLLGVAAGRLRRTLASGWFPVVDVGVAVAINLWVVAGLPAGTFWAQGHDPLGAYLAATAAVWAAIRGVRTGIALLALYAAVVGVEAIGNGAPFDAMGWTAYCELLAWAVVSVLAAVSMVLLARAVARRATAEVAAETRSRALATLHGTVLQALSRIGHLTGTDAPPGRLLAEVHDVATCQLAAAREHAAQFGLVDREDLTVAVSRAGRAASRDGFDVLLDVEDTFTVPTTVAAAVADAVTEALCNVVKHAGVPRATVRARRVPAGARIDVEDDGRGIAGAPPGYGLSHTIVAGVAAVGGRAQIASTPDRGTRVSMIVEADPPPPKGSGLEAWPPLPAPVMLRAAVMVAAMLGAPLALLPADLATYEVVAAGLVLGNVALLLLIMAGRHERLLASNAFLAFDLAVAAAVVIWTASVLPAGTAAELTLLSTTIYVVPTVPLWCFARGIPTGAALLGGAAALELLSAAVNGVPWSGFALLEVLAHFLQVPAAFLVSVLVAGLARRGAATELAEQRRALLRDMVTVSSTALRRIAEMSSGPPSPELVRRVRGVALATGDALEGKLFGRGLGSRLTLVARRYRRRGVDVTLGLSGPGGDADPLDGVPAPVVEAVGTVVDTVLAAITVAGAPAAVVYGARQERDVLVTVRDYGAPLQLDARVLAAAMGAVGGAVRTAAPASGGTLVSVTWPAR